MLASLSAVMRNCARLQFLEAYILPKRPTSRAAVICKLLVDQLVFAPVSTIMLFAALEVMKGTPEQVPVVIQVHLSALYTITRRMATHSLGP